MMAHDYPPMDKEVLALLIAQYYDRWWCCPWGCVGEGEPADEVSHHDLLDRVWRTCFACQVCKRGFTVYGWFTGPYGSAVGHTEIHAGWPPDAHVRARVVENVSDGPQNAEKRP